MKEKENQSQNNGLNYDAQN